MNEPAASPGGARFESALVAFDDMEKRPVPEYLVDHLLVENSMAGLYGARGSGKSFLALDLSATWPGE